MNLNRVLSVCLAACTFAVPSDQAKQTETAPTGARDVVPISADWRFQIDVTDLGEKERWFGRDFDRSRWRQAAVPKAWDLFDEAMWGYEGIGWYATTIPGARARKDKVQRLKFGRVNYYSQVWLNGESLGGNVNGYLPFEFDISGKLKPDADNALVLRVDRRDVERLSKAEMKQPRGK